MQDLTKYKLYIQKTECHSGFKSFLTFYFAVIDSEKADFPLNFISVFPRETKFSNAFTNFFAEVVDLKQFSLQLLNNALKEYANDPDIIAQIQKRINFIAPKPKILRCNLCGQKFEKTSINQKYCIECNTKILLHMDEKQKLKQLKQKLKQKQQLKRKYAPNAKYRLKPKLCFVSSKVISYFREGDLKIE